MKYWEYCAKARNLSRKDISEQTGISTNALSDYARGYKLPHKKNTLKLAEVVGIIPSKTDWQDTCMLMMKDCYGGQFDRAELIFQTGCGSMAVASKFVELSAEDADLISGSFANIRYALEYIEQFYLGGVDAQGKRIFLANLEELEDAVYINDIVGAANSLMDAAELLKGRYKSENE